MKKNYFIFLCIAVFCFQWQPVSAQIQDDTIIDGVVAIVGAHIILKSDLENQYLQFRSQGNISGSSSHVKCQVLETMLFQKLLLAQAEIDSVIITDVQVESEMDKRMRYFIGLAGSPEKLEETYQKSILEIKSEMHDIIKEQMMENNVQQKITKDVAITPTEVKTFFRKLPKDSVPSINSEYEVGMIVKIPFITDAEKGEVRNKLKALKERIARGDDFSTMAILYSEDPGSSKKGGELGLFKRGDMRPEFEASAFKLKPGEISDIVETEDGFHIIQMIERRGEYVNVRHILFQPKVSLVSLNAAKTKLDSIESLIDHKNLTFAEAVLRYSDDPSKNNGGLMINQNSGNSRFESDQLDPKVYFVVDKLKTGEISTPVLFKTDRGKEEYRIYYLKERSNPHKANLDLDYARIQQWALEKKKSDVLDTWINDKTARTFIRVVGPYKNCDFQRKWSFK
ncbi:MAG: peptidylprolyl isomerase [Bacteroidetes bacterium]|nr:peptidylprolyl isomerase [Bacteroidota bacterium]